MAKTKQQPKTQYLYLVIAVDPYWNGKQYRGRYYKFGITTKKNALDRHPSYTEVLLQRDLCEMHGERIESTIRQILKRLRLFDRNCFSKEAISTDSIGADAMKVLVEGVLMSEFVDHTKIDYSSCKPSEWVGIDGYDPVPLWFDPYEAFCKSFQAREKGDAFKKLVLCKYFLDRPAFSKVTDEYADSYDRNRIAWAQRFFFAFNDWIDAVSAKPQLKPMW